MHGVASQHVDGLRHCFWDVLQIGEVCATHRFAHPIGHRVRGDRKADIVQGLIEFGTNMMGAIFIADNGYGSHRP